MGSFVTVAVAVVRDNKVPCRSIEKLLEDKLMADQADRNLVCCSLSFVNGITLLFARNIFRCPLQLL